MQKLRLTGYLILAGATAVANVAAAPPTARQGRHSVQDASAAPAQPKVIRLLLAAAGKGELTADSAGPLLLGAGPAQTSAAFGWLERAKNDDALVSPLLRSRLTRALMDCPAVIVNIARHPKLGADGRYHAYQVGLEAIVGVGEKAAPQDLTSLLQGAGTSQSAAKLRSQVTSAVERLALNPNVGATEASAWINAAGQALSTAVVDGLSEAEAVMTLVGCIDQTSGVEGAILNRVAGLIQRGVPVATESTVAATLPFLKSNNAFERAESSTILGLVGDRRHVKDLIAALDDSEPMVRTNALKALKNLTGMTISGNVSRWRSWRSAQEAWWDDRGAALVHSLGSASPRDLVGILKQVSTQRLYRKDITAQLLPMLDSAPADELRVAIAGLATLRDPSALPSILKLRGHDDSQVRATVEAALMAFRHSGIKVSRVNVLPDY